MKRNPEKYHRRSIRLRTYGYSQEGAYFVTICTQDRKCSLGKIANGDTRLSEAGNMIQSVWSKLLQHYPGVDVDAFVVTPNHIHDIIVLTSVGAGPRACPNGGQPQGVAPTMSLPEVVHRFKSLTTTRYRHRVTENLWPPFVRNFWQRNYYQHIVRSEKELGNIRKYIATNTLKWELDREIPIPSIII